MATPSSSHSLIAESAPCLLPLALQPKGETRPPHEMFSPGFFNALSQHLATEGRAALASIPRADLINTLLQLVAQFSDPKSYFWRRHADLETVAREFELHPKSLLVALQTSLAASAANSPEAEAPPLNTTRRHPAVGMRAPALAILASNIPVLGLQVLMPAMRARCPILFKFPSGCASFPAAVLEALFQELPETRSAFAGLCWHGAQGAGAIESNACSATPGFSPVLVYGSEQAVLDYQQHAEPERVLGYGPKTSVALVVDTGSKSTPSWLQHVARDIALFEQRGCLSVRSVLIVGTAATAEKRAGQLAEALQHLTRDLPLPEKPSPEAAAARHWVDGAVLAGNIVHGDLGTGGAVVTGGYQASPGGRCLEMVSLETLEEALQLLQDTAPSLQGVSLCIDDPAIERAARQRLAAAGIQRIAPVGSLQATGLDWNNGGYCLSDIFS